MLLSADLGSGDLERCHERGVGHHRIKPVAPAELRAALLQVVHGGDAGSPAATAGRPTATGRPLRVLVAEDNRINQRVIVRMLEKQGHVPVVCDDGRAAVEAFAHEVVDVVLMDVQMPEMDGLEATAAIRAYEAAHPARPRVPIVALTAFAMAGDRERCLAAGMDGYLAKPIKEAELTAVLADAGGPAPGSDAAPPAAPAGESVLDEAAALQYAGGDRELLAELLGIFVADAPAQLRALHEALAAADAPALMRAAHTLKGSLRLLGARSAATLAERLEGLGRAGDLSAAPEVAGAFAEALARVVRAATAASAADATAGVGT